MSTVILAILEEQSPPAAAVTHQGFDLSRGPMREKEECHYNCNAFIRVLCYNLNQYGYDLQSVTNISKGIQCKHVSRKKTYTSHGHESCAQLLNKRSYNHS